MQIRSTIMNRTTVSLILSASLLTWIPETFASPPSRNFVVEKALPNSTARNTAAINKAIEECHKAGGGTVTIPPGEYITGSIVLKDNVTLNLPTGTLLRGSQELDDYVYNPKDRSHDARMMGKWSRALIIALNASNIRITGGGTIDGCHVEDKNGEDNLRGPHGIYFSNVKNGVIDNLKIRRASNYGVFLQDVNDIRCSKLKIEEGYDGIHLRTGNNVQIDQCEIYSGDDAIAGGAWNNVKITNCVLNSSCNGLRLIWQAENLLIENCYFYGDGKFSHRGKYRIPCDMLSAIVLQPGAWGATPGPIRNITIRNIRVNNATNLFALYPGKHNEVSDIRLQKIKATDIGPKAIQIENWEPSSTIRNVSLSDLDIEYKGVSRKDFYLPLNITRPEREAHLLPYWGFYGRNINELSLRNVAFRVRNGDPRTAAHVDHVGKLQIDALKINGEEWSAEKLQKDPLCTPVRVDIFGDKAVTRLIPLKTTDTLPMYHPTWGGDGKERVLTNESSIYNEKWENYSFSFQAENAGTVTLKLKGHYDGNPAYRNWIEISGIEIGNEPVLSRSSRSPLLHLEGKAKWKNSTLLVNHDNQASFQFQVKKGQICKLTITARSAGEETPSAPKKK